MPARKKTTARTTTRAKATPAKVGPPPITADPETIARALQDLGINKPYYTARVVGGRIELRLYGGDVVFWPADGGE
jgi:hypothetical protein